MRVDRVIGHLYHRKSRLHSPHKLVSSVSILRAYEDGTGDNDVLMEHLPSVARPEPAANVFPQ